MDKYFAKFPTTIYNNVVVTDISTSARFTDLGRKASTLFYPLEIEAGFRADQLADAYYGDAEMDWLIWLTNNIVDPYYEWYLSEFEFDSYINEKYGSYENAVNEIVFYRNNWTKLEETISVSDYNNTIAPVLKKYYTPQYAENLKILNYVRRPDDIVVATNRIMSYDYPSASPAISFMTGEVLQIWSGGAQVGRGTVITSNTTQVIFQHVSGNVIANTTWPKEIIGSNSGADYFTTNSQIISISIDDLEAVFWDPVTAYDYEFEKNEQRKDMLIINAQYAPSVSEQLRVALKVANTNG